LNLAKHSLADFPSTILATKIHLSLAEKEAGYSLIPFSSYFYYDAFQALGSSTTGSAIGVLVSSLAASLLYFVKLCFAESSVALAITSFKVLVPTKSAITFHLSGIPPAYLTVAFVRRVSSSWVQSDDFLVSSSYLCLMSFAANFSSYA
jgi:hypothetical protein